MDASRESIDALNSCGRGMFELATVHHQSNLAIMALKEEVKELNDKIADLIAQNAELTGEIRARTEVEQKSDERSGAFRILLVERASTAFTTAITSRAAAVLAGMLGVIALQLMGGDGPAWDLFRAIFGADAPTP